MDKQLNGCHSDIRGFEKEPTLPYHLSLRVLVMIHTEYNGLQKILQSLELEVNVEKKTQITLALFCLI